MSFAATLILFLSPVVTNDVSTQVIDAEKGFAQNSREKGQVDAFKQWLAEDAILFNPEPVKGKPLYANREKSAGTLWWQPAYVVTAESGDLAMSTGPFVAHSAKGDAFYGHFLTVWQKQADGSWKVAIDNGISHAPFPEEEWPKQVETGTAQSRKPGPTFDDLQARDRAYAAATSKKEGWASAFAHFAAGDVRLYRNGSRPIIGKVKALTALAADGPASWRPLGGKIASSGELGFTYGKGSFAEGGGHFVYLRIWRFAADNNFELLVELVKPLNK